MAMKYLLPVLSLLLVAIAACEKVTVPQSMEEKMRGKWQIELDSNGKGFLKEYRYTKLPADTSTKYVDTLITPVTISLTNFFVPIGKNPDGSDKYNDTLFNVHRYPWCKLDDRLEFRDGNKGALLTGAEKCPNGEVTEIDIQWGLDDNYTRMYIYNAGELFLGNDNIDAEIKEFADNKLVLRYMEIDNTSNIPRQDTVFYTVTLNKR
jgi:hypothetical protein